jgi:hypothetical protein
MHNVNINYTSKNSFCHKVVDRWNGLPDEAVLSDSVNVFKDIIDYLMRCAKGLV